MHYRNLIISRKSVFESGKFAASEYLYTKTQPFRPFHNWTGELNSKIVVTFSPVTAEPSK